jgi:hypothetical protein
MKTIVSGLMALVLALTMTVGAYARECCDGGKCCNGASCCAKAHSKQPAK